jgi:hypothetical protein
VKYNDMTVRPEKNGAFTRNEHGVGNTVSRPGYNSDYARELVRMTGNKFKRPAK